MSAATIDKQPLTYARFTQQLRAHIKTLITPALIEEHRLKPLGQGSDALERVKNFLSRPPTYGLYSRVPMREWQLIKLPIRAGEPPRPLDDVVYRDEATAYHAVFLKHLDDLMAPPVARGTP
jgi:branched-chain amino acid transport system permease protein